uniref:Uncharacterized protein n=1 Tax=Arundo donax TaxID=35708 RepID=A0A0A9CFZ5_ARUDO
MNFLNVHCRMILTSRLLYKAGMQEDILHVKSCMCIAVGESVEVTAEVGNELLRQLLVGGATGVELREASEEERWGLLGARRGVAREAAAIQVQRVLERRDGAGEVATQPLPLLGRCRRRSRLAGAGRVGAGREGVV